MLRDHISSYMITKLREVQLQPEQDLHFSMHPELHHSSNWPHFLIYSFPQWQQQAVRQLICNLKNITKKMANKWLQISDSAIHSNYTVMQQLIKAIMNISHRILVGCSPNKNQFLQNTPHCFNAAKWVKCSNKKIALSSNILKLWNTVR